MKNKNNILILLFISFFKLGAFTFGSGYAMIPLIQKEIVDEHKWLSNDDILEIMAISESTPGPIAINAATFVGYKIAGIIGAVITTIAIVLPSFIVISIVAKLLNEFSSNIYIQYAFTGIKASVVVLIGRALLNMYKQVEKTSLAYFIIVLDIVLVIILKVNVILAIILSGLIACIYCSYIAKKVNE